MRELEKTHTHTHKIPFYIVHARLTAKMAQFLKNASEMDVDRKSPAERLCSSLTDGCLIIPHTFSPVEQ